jgi:hypothetical protein
MFSAAFGSTQQELLLIRVYTLLAKKAVLYHCSALAGSVESRVIVTS